MNSDNSDALSESSSEISIDPLLERQVQRLIEVQTYLRWIFDGFLWLTIGTASIWALRSDIELWIAAFTWAAVRITLAYNRLPMMGVGICVAMTLATLVWQSSIILWGVNQREKRSLVDQVKRIKKKGKSHPLWHWVCEEKTL
ncbi:hypothetical protein VB774_13640 [Pseudanabaena galeata UHCC 0370]|uniref:Uncharacterized protein n=1 Tax=Pseudanabaena galeata UHCC 0370 TaxID=3110310 RepID=A0ABU5TKD2_9CYAN|nr:MULTISPECIES: hypothetical protein [Pseudanabaena]MEA5478665.1 hypothetical protein [Pseudanabaena galeata UHCC 0370]MEA5488681.1 hypothetical protein [Pseudanabaena sp. CCNP1317]WGS72148.1 hypothetical protein OA858_20950 [Pseudanabaena galeata CCNP1313]